jgi:hypothetical protein
MPLACKMTGALIMGMDVNAIQIKQRIDIVRPHQEPFLFCASHQFDTEDDEESDISFP